MVYVYHNDELINIVFIYVEVEQNVLEASRLYAERFLDADARNHVTFLSNRGRWGTPWRSQRVLAAEEQIFNVVKENYWINT